MESIAIITGASSGVGREFVHQLDHHAGGPLDQLWLIARSKDALERVAAGCTTKTRILPLDLTDPSSFEALKKEISDACADEKTYVQWLINSAGFGRAGKFVEIGEASNAGMVRLNCLAVVELCSLVLPYMRSGSRIINLASMAGTLPLEGFAVYSASKSFVLNFSHALDAELAATGIHVTAVCPKWMKTGFLDHAGSKQSLKKMMFIGFENPTDVVRKAIRSAVLGRGVCVPSFDMKIAYGALAILPVGFVMAAMRFIGEWTTEHLS